MALVALDFETTGFAQARDRIVEVGAVLFSEAGDRLGEFHSLVNPRCRVGATEIHGIQDSDLIDAPSFSEILPGLAEFLNSHVIVAHNKAFDLGFLQQELHRLGTSHEYIEALCTIELVSQIEPTSPRKLMECCAALGLPLEQGHHALNDARMTSHLATHLLHRAKRIRLPEPVQISVPHFLSKQAREPLPRDAAYLAAAESGDFLTSLVARLPVGESSGTAGASQYMDFLDRVISSRDFSTDSVSYLVGLASQLEIGSVPLKNLHLDYFKIMCETARADHYISDRERADLKSAALFLGIPDWEGLVGEPTGITLWTKGIPRFNEPKPDVTGSDFVEIETSTDFSQPAVRTRLRARSVVITGEFSEFSREQGNAAITARGGRATQGVSQKTFAIVAGEGAGPSKLEKAATLRVPILNATEFRTLLDTGELPDRYS